MFRVLALGGPKQHGAPDIFLKAVYFLKESSPANGRLPARTHPNPASDAEARVFRCMRRLRCIVLILCALLPVCGLAAIWFVPSLLDWNQYRTRVEALTAATLGLDVRIIGQIRVELLPRPVLTAGNVQISDADRNISVRTRELRLRMGLGALLTGRLDPRELTLRRADIQITGMPPTLPHLQIRQNAMAVHIASSSLQIGDTRFTGINAALEPAAPNGRLTLRGSATLNDEPFTYMASLAPPDEAGTSALEMRGGSSLPQMGNARFIYSGALTAANTLSGRLSASGANLARFISGPAAAFQIQADIHANAQEITAQPLSLQTGQERLQGRLTLAYGPEPRLQIALTAAQLELTPWLALLTQQTATQLPVSIELGIEEATLYDRPLRHAQVHLDITEHAHVREASAILPGETRLELRNVTGQGDGQTGFTGTASITAPLLRSTLDWLGVNQNLIPPEALRQATLQGGFSVGANIISASGITGTIDAIPVQGSLALHLEDRINAAADLTLERLSIDPWLVIFPAPQTALADIDLSLNLHVAHAEFMGRTFTETNLSFGSDATTLRIGKLTTHLANGTIDLTGTYTREGQISDLNVSMDLPDAAVLADMLPADRRGPARLWSGPLLLQAQGGGSLAALAFQARSSLADLRMDTRVSANLNTRQVSGTFALRHPNAPRLITQLGGLNPRDNCNVQRECDIEKAGRAPWAWLGGGSLSLVAQFTAAPDKITLPYLALSAGTLQTSGNLELSLNGQPTLSGRLEADTLPLPLQAATAQLPVSYMRSLGADISLHVNTVLADGTPLLTDAGATLKMQNGNLSVSVLNAQMEGGRLTGTIGLNAASDTPVLSVDTTMQNVSLTGGLMGINPGIDGFATVRTQVSAHGYSPQAMLASLGGTVDISVHDGSIDGLSLPDILAASVLRPRNTAEAALRRALSGGTTDFSRLSAKAEISNGIATLLGASADTDYGSISIGGTINLPRTSLDMQLAVRPDLADFPELRLLLTGAMDAPQRRTDLSGFARWFSRQ